MPSFLGALEVAVGEFLQTAKVPQLGIHGRQKLGAIEISLARVGLLELIDVYADPHVRTGDEGTNVTYHDIFAEPACQMVLPLFWIVVTFWNRQNIEMCLCKLGA